jgi:hypothetical protein
LRRRKDTEMQKKWTKRARPQASDGWHLGVAADIVDEGVKKTKFGEKEKVRLTYFTDETDLASGEQIRISESLNFTLDKQATLYKRVLALTGEEPTLNSQDIWDGDLLLGRRARILTRRKLSDRGQIFANIVDVTSPAPGDQSVTIPLDFKRAAKPAPAEKPNGKLAPEKTGNDPGVQFPGD